MDSAVAAWLEWADVAHVWWTRRANGAGPAEGRLRDLVRHAREHSPVLGQLLGAIPDAAPLRALPVTGKAQLMPLFDAWCTDRRVRRQAVDAFLADRSRIGDRFLGRYAVWKTSGTSGVPGIFVQDPHALAVYEALVLDRFAAMRIDTGRVVAGGARRALLCASNDHFASVALWRHLERISPTARSLTCSVLSPVARTVAQLNEFAPAFVAGYPSMLLLLAREQLARRLRIAPAVAWCGGEHLGAAAQSEIESALGCPVINEYGASECLCIAHGCDEGWLHVNEDWVIVEPIEADGTPTTAGRTSHSVLVTNLANHVQPVLRYDVGDRVAVRASACPCGNPALAIRVEGRTDDILHLPDRDGHARSLPPMAFTTVLDETCGEHRYQLVQHDDARVGLRLPLELEAPERRRIARRSVRALRELLAVHDLAHVHVAVDACGPSADAASGKLKTVVAQPRRAPAHSH
jgi:phenylacetate-coenzyme A ligase PaaK-like adenylate-forming protein